MRLFFRHFEFFPTFWKNKIFEFFFSKIHFLIEISENLTTYANYECLKLKIQNPQ